MQRKQPLHDDDSRRPKHFRLRGSRVGGEVVHRKLDTVTVSQSCDLLDEELVLQGIRCIKIQSRALLQWKVREIAIVAIEFEHLGFQRRLQVMRQKALP